jgi:hypothetical protein
MNKGRNKIHTCKDLKNKFNLTFSIVIISTVIKKKEENSTLEWNTGQLCSKQVCYQVSHHFQAGKVAPHEPMKQQ